MLKYRLPIGLAMFAALLLMIYADDRLGAVNVSGTLLGWARGGEGLLPPGLLIFAAFGFLVILAAGELCAMAQARGVPAEPWIVQFAAISAFAAMYLAPRQAAGSTQLAWLGAALAGSFILAMARHAWRRETAGAIASGATAMFGAIYLGVLPGFFLLVREGHSAWVLAAIVMITKACDIGAYTAGHLWGKRKLIPWLSPGKTVEGLIGGAALSIVVAVSLAALNNQFEWAASCALNPLTGETIFTHRAYPLTFAAGLGLLLALIGHAGDLLESLIKRDAGFKDSGRTLPGFGGVLDVIDSPLAVAPLAFFLLKAA